MPLVILLIFALSSCFVVPTFKDEMNIYLGKNVMRMFSDVPYSKWVTYKHKQTGLSYGIGYVGKTKIIDNIYEEHTIKYRSWFSKTQGECTVRFKVRKSDNIIVSWRSEGKKSDCVGRGSTE